MVNFVIKLNFKFSCFVDLVKTALGGLDPLSIPQVNPVCLQVLDVVGFPVVSGFHDFTDVLQFYSLLPIEMTSVDQVTYLQGTRRTVGPCGILGDHVCEFSVSFSFAYVHRIIDGGQMGSDPATMEQLTR